jgi:tight adherence protein B
VVDELRVGSHPARAFAAAADECAATGNAGAREAAQTLREVAARALLGGDVGQGLRQRAAAAQRGGLTSGGALWARLAACWELSHREGVPMAYVVAAARTDLVERIRFGERTDAALAGARSTAKILAALPIFSMGLGQAMGADPLGVLVSGPGSLLLAFGCGLIWAGLAWARRITEGARP